MLLLVTIRAQICSYLYIYISKKYSPRVLYRNLYRFQIFSFSQRRDRIESNLK